MLRSIFLALLTSITLTGCPYEGSYDWLDQLEPSNDTESEDSTEDNAEGSTQATEMMVIDAIAINIEDASIPEPDATAETPDTAAPASEPDAKVIVTPDAEIVPTPEPDAEQPICDEGQTLVDGICTETVTFRWTPGQAYWNREHSPDVYPIHEWNYQDDYTMPANVTRVNLQVECFGSWSNFPSRFTVDNLDPTNVEASIQMEVSKVNAIYDCTIFWSFYCDDSNDRCWSNIRPDRMREENILLGETTVQVNSREPENATVGMYTIGGQYSHMYSYTWDWIPNNP